MSSSSSSTRATSPYDPTLRSEPSSPKPLTGNIGKPHSSRSDKLEVKSISIPFGKEKDGVVYYIVNVVTSTDQKWSLFKRFSQFERLHQILVELFGHRGFPPGADLPPKKFKFFVSHVTSHFIEERRCLLDSYLQKMLKVSDVVHSSVFLDFLTTDYADGYYEPPVIGGNIADDAEVTGVCIPQTRLMSDHVLYQVDVSNARKRKTFSKWTVLKRFGQFFDLDAALRAEYAEDYATLNSLPASPTRQSKLLYDHMDPHFIEHRRVLLENYLNKLLNMPVIAKNPTFLAFLGVSL